MPRWSGLSIIDLSTVRTIRPLAPPDVTLLADEPAAVAAPGTDEGMFHQVATTLVANALKFTRDGPVRVHLAGPPRGAGAMQAGERGADHA